MKKYSFIIIIKFLLLIIPVVGSSQSLFLNGTDTLFISSGETVSSVGGFKFIGSGGTKFSFPRETTPSNTSPNTRKVLATNANATFEVRNVASNQLANFYVDVMVMSNRASVDLVIDNKNTTSKYQLKVNQLDRLGYNDILTEWTINRDNSNQNDIHNLTFNWGNDLEPTLISNKRLFVYDNALSAWCQLPSSNTVVDEVANTLTYTNYSGALTNTKFMIAESISTGNLTIVASGGDNYGSTWAYKNGLLAPLSNSPSLINSSEVQNYLANGSLTIEAGNIIHNASLSLTSGLKEIAKKITINNSVISSNSSSIEFNLDTLIFATGATVSSSGQLIISPKTISNLIEIGGTSGVLNIPSSYFTTNFADGFSNIQIGSNLQSGNIILNSFTLRDNMTILTSGTLTLGGKPVLGNNHLTLGSNITSVVGNTSSRYFQTNGTGSLRRSIPDNVTCLFPIGNSSYNPISIKNRTGASDLFSINIEDSVYLNGTSGVSISKSYIKRTWNIGKNNANAGSGIDMTFSWNSSDIVGSLTTPTMNHHTGSRWEIPTMGTSSVSGTTLTYTGYTGTFSPFAIGGSSAVALPVELISFQATCQNDQVRLDWATASEKNNDRFELYKSENVMDWQLIGTQKGSGTTSERHTYTMVDQNPLHTAYYRLKNIDYDGEYKWSNIIVSKCQEPQSTTMLYPNPTNDFVILSTLFEEGMYCQIIDVKGSLLLQQRLLSSKTHLSVKELPADCYFIKVIKPSGIEILKLLKQ